MNPSRKTFLSVLLAALICVCAFAVNVSAVVSPDGDVTVAEAISLAARASAAYNGETIPSSQGGQWYDAYVDYAISHNLMSEGEFDDFTRPAKRYEVAVLFGKALPADVFGAINDVAEIPDVSKAEGYYSTLLSLYNAGVVVGSDAYGNFYPENEITRVEMDSIVNRVAFEDARLEKDLKVRSKDDAYSLAYIYAYDYSNEGAPSGWLLDNSAGTPRTELANGYNTITDVSTTQSSALIREFNKTETGKFTLNTKVKLFDGFDGFALEFRNEADETVYKLVTEGGEWNVVGADGGLTAVTNGASSEYEFEFVITVDLDNLESTTQINGGEIVTNELCVDASGANLYNFRFATGVAETISAVVGTTDITANYAVYDNFDWGTDAWQGEGFSANADFEMALANGTASKSFDAISGTVVANFMAYLNGNALTYEMKSQGEALVTLTFDGTSMYANGTKLYDYTDGLWYRVRVEADTFEHTATVYLNGIERGTIDLTNKATSVDEVSFVNEGTASVAIDRVNVFVKQTHDDYVKAPVKPAGEENYTVGLNVCNLWANGYTSYGWATITPYDDFQPALGYYDEGTPEVADWEIKYMVEHGIDFQAFCWYPSSTTVIKNEKEHMVDGYKFAEYSDMMKYALIWESSGGVPSYESFTQNYVPYLIENHFTDDRYMEIDGQLVFIVYNAYGPATIANAMGANSQLKNAFTYLEQEVKKVTGKGMIFLATGIASSGSVDGLDEMGFDGNYAYNWGMAGSSLEHNKSANTSVAAASHVYTVPTISMGFNSIPWHGERFDIMSAADFKSANIWARDVYPTIKVPTEEWQKNFVMLSTWNEYGEGTYLMPTAEENGFKYLNAVKSVYTSEASATGELPTEDQLYRINHMYPQYRRLLRNNGEYDAIIDYTGTSESTIKARGITTSNVKSVEYTSKGLTGTVNGDAQIIKSGLNLDASKAKYMKIYLDVPNGTSVEVYFTTNASTTYNNNKKYTVTAQKDEDENVVILDVSSLLDPDDTIIDVGPLLGVETKEDEGSYILIDASENKYWTGTITGLRIEPGEISWLESISGVEGNDFTLSKVEFFSSLETENRYITIDGVSSKMRFFPELSANGDYLIAFDPKTALDYKLDAFHTWDKENGVLNLKINKHEVEYTVGSSSYTLDGSTKSLGFTLYSTDGLPMIPIEMLCEDVGYEYSRTNEDGIVIDTPQKDLVEEKFANKKAGSWEFNTDGYTEGWSGSSVINAGAAGGYLVTEAVTASKDPVIFYNETLEWAASDYTKFEIKVRYNHAGNTPSAMQIFFATEDAKGNVSVMSQPNSFSITLNSTDSQGEWETYTYDLTKLSTWKNTITGIRFDPFSASGEMDIDYIRFTK